MIYFSKKVSFNLAVIFTVAFTFFACSDSGGSDDSPITVKKAKITGVSQKGPFVEGSTAILHELDENFAKTGRSFTEMITDEKGSFEIKDVELVSPYAVLEVNGQYRNEITGKVTSGAISLFAIADLREKDNLNVNILTHLEYYRVLNLVENEGKSLEEAKEQAQNEILSVFGINSDNFKNSEDMSIFGTSESDAALLAISILMQGDLNEGEFLQRLTKFGKSIEETGEWEDEKVKTAMADWAVAPPLEKAFCMYDFDPNNCWAMPTGDMCANGILIEFCPGAEPTSTFEFVKDNMLAWELSSDIPDFEKYITSFWSTNYELGICNAGTNKNIKKPYNVNSKNKNVDYVCKNNVWQIALSIDIDTQGFNCNASNEGEIKNVGAQSYTCKNNEWDYSTYLELLLAGTQNCLGQSCINNECETTMGPPMEYEDYVFTCKDGVWQVLDNPVCEKTYPYEGKPEYILVCEE